MRYLTLEDIKLQVSQTADVDDDLLTMLGNAAEQATENQIDRPLRELEDCAGRIPHALRQAMLMLVGTLYDNRESVTFAQSHALAAYEVMIGPYRRY